jgi:NDP-sugar pyrophosphorylase family protein
MVEHGVILAAGRGTRLGRLTDEVPKPLLEVGGRPVLLRILDGLESAGVRRVIVVAGYRSEQVVAAVADRPGVGVVVQDELDGTAGAVRSASAHLRGGPFVYGWGDILIEPGNYRRIMAAAAGADAVIGVNPVDDPAAGAAVTVDGAGRVIDIVEKPPRGTSSTKWNSAGIGVLGASVWPHLAALAPSPRGEYELTDAIAALIAAGADVRAEPILGPWIDIGTPEALAEARRVFGSATSPPGSAS